MRVMRGGGGAHGSSSSPPPPPEVPESFDLFRRPLRTSPIPVPPCPTPSSTRPAIPSFRSALWRCGTGRGDSSSAGRRDRPGEQTAGRDGTGCRDGPLGQDIGMRWYGSTAEGRTAGFVGCADGMGGCNATGGGDGRTTGWRYGTVPIWGLHLLVILT